MDHQGQNHCSRTKTLKNQKKKQGFAEKLEGYKSHVTYSPRNASRSNDTPNSKTKHQIAPTGLKNVLAEIKKKISAM